MGSPRQLDILKGLYDKNQKEDGALIVVDPVMGDNNLVKEDFYSEKGKRNARRDAGFMQHSRYNYSQCYRSVSAYWGNISRWSGK